MSEKDNNERKKAHHIEAPDIELSVRETFGIDIDLKVPAFSAVSYTHLTLPTISDV